MMVIINLLDSINNDDYQIIENASNIIIISADQQSILIFDTETGIITDYLYSDGNVYHGILSDDPSKTSLFGFDVDSPQSEAQNLAGQIMINVGGYVSEIGPVGLASGVLLIIAGTFICADANGCFSMDGTNWTRVVKTGVDVGSNLPYAKLFSSLAGKLAKYGLFDSLTEGLSGLVEHADDIYYYTQQGLYGLITIAGETYNNNFYNKSLLEIGLDTALNIIPLRSFSKSFTEVPYRICESAVKVTEESKTFVKEIFRMLDDYDKESMIFLDSISHRAQKAVFASINTVDTTINVLIRNLFSQIYSQIMKLGYSTYDDAKREVDGFITKSKESYYVANQCNISFNFFERGVTI